MSAHQKEIIRAGVPLENASKVLIMIHGRGASAADILSIAQYLDVDDYALLAPQATNYTWYPYSFLAPKEQNEPWLSSAISLVDEIVKDVTKENENRKIFLLGFSQGACLTLEFAARHARRYGGIAAFTGGLIGDSLGLSAYKGNFEGTPVFIGSSDPDPHVPVERVHQSAEILSELGASVTTKIYEGMGHTINAEEFQLANELIFSR